MTDKRDKLCQREISYVSYISFIDFISFISFIGFIGKEADNDITMSGQEDRLKAVEPETANCEQQQRHDTLTKSERVCSRNTVEQLFGGGKSRAMSAFPIRMVYMITDRQEGEPAAQMLVSVPKRCFKRAVKRNRVKRQVREAYRHLKHGVIEAMTARQHDKKVVMAFICIDNNLHPTERIARKMQNLLSRLEEHISGKEQAQERSEQSKHE